MCNATLVQCPSTRGYSRASRRTRQQEWPPDPVRVRQRSVTPSPCALLSLVASTFNTIQGKTQMGRTEQKIRAHTIYTHNDVTQEVISYAMFPVRYISPPLSSGRPRPGSYHTFLACFKGQWSPPLAYTTLSFLMGSQSPTLFV